MTDLDNYDIGYVNANLDDMTDAEAKEYLESIEADIYLSSVEFHDSKYL